MNCCENRYSCNCPARNVVVRMDIGPIVAVCTIILFAVLMARVDEAPCQAVTTKNTKAAVHRKITVIPMGDESDKVPGPISSPVPVKPAPDGGAR